MYVFLIRRNVVVDIIPTDRPVATNCLLSQWQCGDGTCIELSQRCDFREYNCPDGSDEFDCCECSYNIIVLLLLTTNSNNCTIA